MARLLEYTSFSSRAYLVKQPIVRRSLCSLAQYLGQVLLGRHLFLLKSLEAGQHGPDVAVGRSASGASAPVSVDIAKP